MDGLPRQVLSLYASLICQLLRPGVPDPAKKMRLKEFRTELRHAQERVAGTAWSAVAPAMLRKKRHLGSSLGGLQHFP